MLPRLCLSRRQLDLPCPLMSATCFNEAVEHPLARAALALGAGVGTCLGTSWRRDAQKGTWHSLRPNSNAELDESLASYFYTGINRPPGLPLSVFLSCFIFIHFFVYFWCLWRDFQVIIAFRDVVLLISWVSLSCSCSGVIFIALSGLLPLLIAVGVAVLLLLLKL